MQPAKILLKRKREKGITMLLVVAILSSLLSISVGIFDVIFGQIQLSGEISDSFSAFYAADEGIEKTLYLDRITNINNPLGICAGTGGGAGCYTALAVNAQSGGCYDIAVDKVGASTNLKVLGQYRCGANPVRVVKRGFNLTY